MKISNLLLATLASAATTPSFASANIGLFPSEIVHPQSVNLRGLKKTNTADDTEVPVPADAPVAEHAADTAAAPAEGQVAADAQAPVEGEGVAETETDDAAEGIDEAFPEDDEAAVESEETTGGVEGGGVSPYVWYSVGGVVALIGAYFACCKKSDDGYSRIQ